MKLLTILAGISLVLPAFAATNDVNPLTKRCVSPARGHNLVIEFNQDMSSAQLSEQTATGLSTRGVLSCTKTDAGDKIQTVGGPKQSASVQCRDTQKADAGYSALLFKTGDTGVYQVELSEETIAGPKLIELMSCE